MVCRCEEVTDADVRDAVRNGARDIDAVKRATRAGMGLCQGRSCPTMIARILSQETGRPVSDFAPSTLRPPVRAIPASVLGATDAKKARRRAP